MQTDHDPKSIATLLGNGALQKILMKSQVIGRLNQKLQDFLPRDLQLICRVINYEDQQITIGVPTSNCATRLRYLEPDFLEKLKFESDDTKFYRIKIRVLGY